MWPVYGCPFAHQLVLYLVDYESCPHDAAANARRMAVSIFSSESLFCGLFFGDLAMGRFLFCIL